MVACGYAHKLLNCIHGNNPMVRRELSSIYYGRLSRKSSKIIDWRRRKWKEKIYTEEYLSGKANNP